jgi:type I restriction enzyme S subunit
VLTRRCECDDPRYLNAYFQTKPFQRSLVRIGNGILAHRMRIPMELLKCEPFPRPPASEQLEIVRYIARATANLTVAIEHAQREVLLLSEYQARLIADVVTGRLDVREAAAGLSNETSQEEMVHDDAEPFFEDDLEDSDSDLETALEEVEV